MKWRSHPCSVYGRVLEGRESSLAVTDLPSLREHFLWTWIGDILGDEHVRNAFQQARLTGYVFRDVDILTGSVWSPSTRLYELNATGFAGFARIDEGVSLTSWCDDCKVYSYRFRAPISRLLDMGKWDGSDLFRMWPVTWTLCTERVRDVIAEHSLSGIAAVPIEELDVPNLQFSPGAPSESLTNAALDRLRADSDYILAVRP